MELSHKRSSIFPEGWGIVIGVPALVIVAWLIPAIPGIRELPFCGVKHFTGFDCPGCGLTSSIVALVHGQIRASIDRHPLGIVIMTWLVYMFGRSIFALIAGRLPRPLLTQGQRDIIMYVFLVALIFQWIIKLLIRNLVNQ